jgi:hypothetical protein
MHNNHNIGGNAKNLEHKKSLANMNKLLVDLVKLPS